MEIELWMWGLALFIAFFIPAMIYYGIHYLLHGKYGEGDENVLRAANGFGKLAQDARRRLAVFNCDI